MPIRLQALQRYFAELRRRRVIRAVGAYVLLAWLILQVADATFEPLGLPPWSQRALIISLAVGLLLVCAFAWVYDLGTRGLVRTEPLPDRRKPDRIAADAAPSQASPALAPAPVSEDSASVAVLPFTDLSQAHDQDWFCDGLAEEIIDSLCCVRGLRVASRTASFRFRDGSVDPREIGSQLQVSAILEGSVRKAGERLKVVAQLVDASNGYHVWSESFERRLEDVFAIQTEIATKVAAALKLSMSAHGLGRSLRLAPSNLEAYEFYLRGRQMAGQTTATAWRHAPRMFRRAIELDPNYAQALAGLADSLAQQSLWRFVPAAQVLPEAAAAAAKALDLAPDLAEAHVAQGHVRSLMGDHDGAVRSFERAIALNPDLHEAYYYFARHCYSQGKHQRAVELFESAYRARPDEYVVLALATSALEALGDTVASRAMAERATPGLIRQCEMEPENARLHYMAAGELLRVGRREEAETYAEKALALRPDDFSTLYNLACFYCLAGDNARALDMLERAFEHGGGYFDWIINDPDLKKLHDHARFKQLLGQIRDMPEL